MAEQPIDGVAVEPKPARPAPLLPVAVGLMIGVVIDSRLTLAGWMSLLAVVPAAWLVLHRRGRGASAAAGLAIAAAGVGAARHELADRRWPADHVVRFTGEEPVLTTVHGTVATPPRVAEPDRDLPLPYPVPPKTRFIMDACGVRGEGGVVAVSGRVAVTVKDVLLSLAPGDRVRISGWLYRSRAPQNPGAFDWRLNMRRDGVLVGLSCQHAESVVPDAASVESAATSVVRARTAAVLERVRTRLRGYLLDGSFVDDDPAAGVIRAMVMGERSAVSRAMNDAFVRTGNAHFLAASGMHVGWLALTGWWIMRLLGVHYRRAAIFVGLLILAFMVLAEPRPSILRAGIIGLLGCWSMYARGTIAPVNWLAAAAIIILLIDPADLFRPAFQYSFLAVLALLHLCPVVARTLAGIPARFNRPALTWCVDHRLFDELVARGEIPEIKSLSMFYVFARWILQLAMLAFSAWFVTAPLACHQFNVFSPWGWLGTLVLWFLALPAVIVGFLMLLFGSLLPSTGLVFGPLLAGITHAMVSVVDGLARVPGTYVDGRSPSAAWVVAAYAVLIAWVYGRGPAFAPIREALARRLHSRARLAFPAAAALLFAWWLLPPRWFRAERGALVVWQLAVGDGAATVMELPDGRVWAYDVGTRSPFDAGIVAADLLRARGIRWLDAIVVSHANMDHYGGIESLLRRVSVGRVVVNDHFERFSSPGNAARRFLDKLRVAGVPVEVIRGPHVFADTGDVRIESIWPPPAEDRLIPSANDCSTVLRVEYQGRAVLLTGDITEHAVGGLLSAGRELKSDVLALPHHGSVIHNTRAFIDAVAPGAAVRSVAQPRRLTTNGIESIVGDARYYSTADDGCVRVSIRDGVLDVRPAAE